MKYIVTTGGRNSSVFYTISICTMLYKREGKERDGRGQQDYRGGVHGTFAGSDSRRTKSAPPDGCVV